jgi:integrase
MDRRLEEGEIIMASIYRRGKTFWITYRVGGKNVCHSLNTNNGREAVEMKKRFEALKTNGLLSKPSSTPIGPFLQALCEYWRKTREGKGAETDIGRLRGVFGQRCEAMKLRKHTPQEFRDRSKAFDLAGLYLPVKKLEDVTTAAITAHLKSRFMDGQVSGKTANKIRGVLSSMFSYAVEYHGYICPDPDCRNPAEAVKRFAEETPPIVWLKNGEIQQQLDALSDLPEIRAMVAMYIYAGLRRAEALWLTTDDLDFEKRLIRIQGKDIDGQKWKPKTKRNRTVPINSTLMIELANYLPLQHGVWFFPSHGGKRWDDDYFAECLREANNAKGLEWSCAEYRHTFGSHLAQKGISLYKISELMGNSPEICRRHYAALMPQEMHDEVEFEF